MSYEELTNFDVIYENGDTFTTDYIISSSINIYENKTEIILLKSRKTNIENENYYFHNNYEIIKNLNKDSEFLFDENNKEQSNLLVGNIIKWDYNYTDIFKCRVDYKNQINVYYINSFMGNNASLLLTQLRNVVYYLIVIHIL